VLARPILFRVGPCFGLLFSGRARAGPKSPAHIPSTSHDQCPLMHVAVSQLMSPRIAVLEDIIIHQDRLTFFTLDLDVCLEVTLSTNFSSPWLGLIFLTLLNYHQCLARTFLRLNSVVLSIRHNSFKIFLRFIYVIIHNKWLKPSRQRLQYRIGDRHQGGKSQWYSL
jgi:hypothetical protein